MDQVRESLNDSCHLRQTLSSQDKPLDLLEHTVQSTLIISASVKEKRYMYILNN